MYIKFTLVLGKCHISSTVFSILHIIYNEQAEFSFSAPSVYCINLYTIKIYKKCSFYNKYDKYNNF
jgi:hypothetical protein